MKDHEKRELVNELTEIAKQYGQAQQLRDRISHCVLGEINRLESENAAMRTRIAELQASVAWYSGRHEEDDKIIDALEIENAMLRQGDTCARQCEGTAYRIDGQRVRHHLTELAKFADRAALVLATLEAENSDEEEQIQQIIDGISTWATPAILGAVTANAGQMADREGK